MCVISHQHNTFRYCFICWKLVPIGIHMKCTSRIKDPIFIRFGTTIRNEKEFSITVVNFYNTSFTELIRLFSLLIGNNFLFLILQLVALRFNMAFLFVVVADLLFIFKLRSTPVSPLEFLSCVLPQTTKPSPWASDPTISCFIFSLEYKASCTLSREECHDYTI